MRISDAFAWGSLNQQAGAIRHQRQQAGLSYPLPAEIDEQALDRLLFPPSEPSAVQRPEPAWPQVHDGLRRKGVTLDLLWQEYKAEQPDGYLTC